jgi:hypothetical protein
MGTLCAFEPKAMTSSQGFRIYDLRVRPDGKVDGNGFPSYQTKLTSLDWQQFSDQLIDSTKFDTADYAKLWAAVGSLALTGSILTSVWVSR